MKKLIFNFSNITQFNEQFKFVEFLTKIDHKFEINFLVNEYSGAFNMEALLNKITNAGFKYVLCKDLIGIKKKDFLVSVLHKMPQVVLNILNKNKGYNYAIYKSRLRDSFCQLNSYQKYFKSSTPDLLIVSEDGVGANIHLIKAAEISGVKTMILPYEYSGEKQLVIGAKNRFVYQINDTGLSKKDFDKYYFNVEGKYCGFYSKEEIRAYMNSNVLPTNVKTVHGGLADKIASESKAMSAHYFKEGLSNDKVVLTGSVNDDVLLELLKSREKRKQELYSQFSFKEDLPLIVFSFIPEYPNNTMYKTYSKYINSVSASLNQLSKFNVLYQFHPAVPQEQRDLTKKFKLSVSDISTIELISMADLYMTSYSSTIRWAIAASVPVIHLDLYSFDYDDFKSCSGVKFVSTEKEFDEVVGQLNNDNGFYLNLKTKQNENANDWGMLDGKSGERIINLIDSLCR